MCLIAFHWQPERATPLLIAANRDEFYERPTEPLAWWEAGRILAGRDLRAGGTWLGVSCTGRFAAITNFRDPALLKTGTPSRGRIPVSFLEAEASAQAFLEALRPEAAAYSPFNLLLFDGRELLGYESRHDQVVPFAPGIHAVSNGRFDEPWPKALLVQAGLAEAEADDEALLRLLRDDRPSEDGRLPRTGVPLDLERALSPVFIRTPTYGTRASTILRLGRERAAILEQSHAATGTPTRRRFTFEPEPGSR